MDGGLTLAKPMNAMSGRPANSFAPMNADEHMGFAGDRQVSVLTSLTLPRRRMVIAYTGGGDASWLLAGHQEPVAGSHSSEPQVVRHAVAGGVRRSLTRTSIVVLACANNQAFAPVI
ncbi:hypothetical protein H6P81_021682 [Aristolochia fimbriata]|uniref:Uncharacterized protein n=1 Tax=Aristolochia fimbriata TaxID=158543 RepID=A0AAV7DQ78_ARIFI|nr:hypothetical protein H6P81_021682 [Aristolochia fimbriata]